MFIFAAVRSHINNNIALTVLFVCCLVIQNIESATDLVNYAKVTMRMWRIASS